MNDRRVGIIAGVTVLGAAFACATATAEARITVNRSIAGVGLGMTAREVRAAIGTPTLETSAGSGARSLVYRKRALVVTLIGSRVAIVSARSRRQRTSGARGVGAGIGTRALRGRLHGERCGTKAGVAFCRVGSIRPGRRSTTFQIEGGRVVTVTIARGLA